MDIRNLLLRIYLISNKTIRKSLFPGNSVAIISVSGWGCLFKVVTELKRRYIYVIYLGMAFAHHFPHSPKSSSEQSMDVFVQSESIFLSFALKIC